MLKFFGKGSAFADDNTCAYFIDNRDMVLIDFSLEAFPKFRRLDFTDIDTIYILVTHTHGDHISGIGTLIHYAFHYLNIPVIVAAPSDTIIYNMKFLLDKIEGCRKEAYSVISTNKLNKYWFRASIPTTHTSTHKDNCFGYALLVDKTLTVYTGDTNKLEPFVSFLVFTSAARKCMYTEICANDSNVHLQIDKFLDDLIELQRQGTEVYLMHLDNEKVIREMIQDTGIKIVEPI